MKAAILLSGGVDSASAAYILKKRGYDLIAIHLKIRPCSESEKLNPRSCSSAEHEKDARKVAESLEIPFYVYHLEKEFERTVVKNFISAYNEGRTPNPCVLCNGYVRFPYVWNKLNKQGIGHIATGHYARIESIDGEYCLIRGKDKMRDQSYFLFRLPKHLLPHLLFPLGDLTKERVREIAKKQNLSVHEKKASQDFCFLPDDYREYLKTLIPEKEGLIYDTEGKVIGKHQGIQNFTVGQRKGLGSFGEPAYVVKIEPEDNSITIGKKKDAYSSEARVGKLHLFEKPKKNFSYLVKIRYSHKGEEAEIELKDDKTAILSFRNPVLSVTPGQSAVFYDEEKVLGGGEIIE